MTNQEFRAIRKLLDLSGAQLAAILKTTKQSVWRWETNGPYAQKVPPLEAEVMRWLARGFRPADWPLHPAQRSRPAPPRYQEVRHGGRRSLPQRAAGLQGGEEAHSGEGQVNHGR